MTHENMIPDDVMTQLLAEINSDPEHAVIRMQDLVQLYRDDARLPFLHGSVLAGLGHFTQAHQKMREAVGMAPDYALARFQLGLLELTSGDGGAAQRTWASLRDLPADNPFKLFVDGLLHMIRDEFPEAMRLLQEGIERNTELPALNKDMSMLVLEMAQKMKVVPDEPQFESDANFLLKQFSFKPTKH